MSGPTGKDILIIPDVHCHPEYDNDRLKHLSKFIMDTQPDTIVCLGDFWDMPSLSSFDKGRKTAEGKRYQFDLKSGLTGMDLLWSEVTKFNKNRSKSKKAHYAPWGIFVLGNHEQGRMDKVAHYNPELDGLIKLEDLDLDKYWDQIVPFKETAVYEGFALSHYFASGVRGHPVSGENPADTMIKKLGMSAIQGHVHTMDIKQRTRADGKRVLGIVAGCYTHPSHVEGWNANTHHLWWNGVVVLKGAHDGQAEEIQTVSQKRLQELYA